MAITIKAARQVPKVALCDFTYADLVSGVYSPMVNLPLNAIVLEVKLFITTIFNSGTDDKFSVGDKVGSASATATTYQAQSADVTAAGLVGTGGTPTGIPTTDATSVGVVWTATGGAATAGIGRLLIEYVVNGAEDSTFEN